MVVLLECFSCPSIFFFFKFEHRGSSGAKPNNICLFEQRGSSGAKSNSSTLETVNNTNDISSNKSTQIEKEETSSSSLVFGYLNLFSDGVVSFLVSIINFTAAFFYENALPYICL